MSTARVRGAYVPFQSALFGLVLRLMVKPVLRGRPELNQHYDLIPLVHVFAAELGKRSWFCACAESCTGGGLAQALTSVSGSSAWFERGVVSYSNAAKRELLDVPQELLSTYGAVSEQVARAMAEGMLAHSRAQTSVAITGVAGPEGGSADKPVGMVIFAWASIDREPRIDRQQFAGDRAAVRQQSVLFALRGWLDYLTEAP